MAHRHGVKILGTLIFEPRDDGSSDADLLKLLVGPLPSSQSAQPYGPASPSTTGSYSGLPISTYYADLLAEFAKCRGFDGYLLNVEIRLVGGTEHARALCHWTSLLTASMKRIIGAHAEVIWYGPSVTARAIKYIKF